jgi:hypothetical protein
VAGRIGPIEKSSDLIANCTQNLLACSIVPKATFLPRVKKGSQVKVGPLVTMAWRVLGLRMEGTASSWRLAANILNKQSRTNDKGWSSSLEVGRGANNPSP